MAIKNVIFDFGNVLVRWDLKPFYQEYFADEAKYDYFINNVCTSDWIRRMDKGEDWKMCEKELCSKFPEWEEPIKMYHTHWQDMFHGVVEGMSEFIDSLREAGYNVYGLSNWAPETFPVACKMFPILEKVPDRVVSGFVNMVKPNHDIYEFLLQKYNLKAEESLFIDDSPANIAAAEQVGIHGIVFTDFDSFLKEFRTICSEKC